MIKRIIEDIKKIPGVRTAFQVDDRIVVDLEEQLCFICKKEPANRGLLSPCVCSKCWNDFIDGKNRHLEH